MEYIGILLDLFTSLRHRGNDTLYPVFVQLLLSLGPDNLTFLTKQHRQTLRGFLLLNDRSLLMATLQALEQIGNADDLPSVSRLVKRNILTNEDAEIQEAARHCLTILEANLERAKSTDTLLRPVSAENLPLRELLRPASEHTGKSEVNLLRPVENIDAEIPS